jgi:hypothetical protein
VVTLGLFYFQRLHIDVGEKIMTTSYLTRPQLINKYPVPKSRPGLRNWVKYYGFPKPFYANQNTPIWTDDDVEEWFANLPDNHHDILSGVQSQEG